MRQLKQRSASNRLKGEAIARIQAWTTEKDWLYGTLLRAKQQVHHIGDRIVRLDLAIRDERVAFGK